MKKIKLLNVLVLGLIVIFVLFFIGNIYITFFSDFMDQFAHLNDDFIFGSFTPYVGLLFSVLTFVGLLYVRNGLRISISEGVFNNKSSQRFLTAGKFFVLSGILGGVFDVAIFIRSQGSTGFASFAHNFLLIILAFVLYIIADIIKNGNELKLDSELTI